MRDEPKIFVVRQAEWRLYWLLMCSIFSKQKQKVNFLWKKASSVFTPGFLQNEGEIIHLWVKTKDHIEENSLMNEHLLIQPTTRHFQWPLIVGRDHVHLHWCWAFLVLSERFSFHPEAQWAYLSCLLLLVWELRNERAESPSVGLGNMRHRPLCCSSNPGVPNKFFFLQRLRALLWLSLVLFLGFIVVLSREAQGERWLYHLDWRLTSCFWKRT